MVNPFYWVTLPLALMASAQTGSSRTLEDVAYGTTGGVSLRMDAHIPPGGAPHPAVILVHGGGWIAGDRRFNLQPLFRPLEDAGFAWFSISYRLAKDITQFGAATEDVRLAVRHVKVNAARYNIDPDRVALLGESAGAQLASMAALNGGESLRAVVLIYGPSDLELMARTSPNVPDGLRQAVQGTPWAELLLAGLRRLSPINYVRAGIPPFLLIHGTADRIVPFEQSKLMCERIRGVGGACDLYAVTGEGHGLRRWSEAGTGAAYKKYLVDWLGAQIKRVSTAD